MVLITAIERQPRQQALAIICSKHEKKPSRELKDSMTSMCHQTISLDRNYLKTSNRHYELGSYSKGKNSLDRLRGRCEQVIESSDVKKDPEWMQKKANALRANPSLGQLNFPGYENNTLNFLSDKVKLFRAMSNCKSFDKCQSKPYAISSHVRGWLQLKRQSLTIQASNPRDTLD